MLDISSAIDYSHSPCANGIRKNGAVQFCTMQTPGVFYREMWF